MKIKLRKLTNSELTRVKVSQIEDDVLGVDDVEGGQQVRCVDAEQAVHQLQRLFAVVPEEYQISDLACGDCSLTCPRGGCWC